MKHDEIHFVTVDEDLVKVKASDIKGISRNGDKDATITCVEKEYFVSDHEAEHIMELLFKK